MQNLYHDSSTICLSNWYWNCLFWKQTPLWHFKWNCNIWRRESILIAPKTTFTMQCSAIQYIYFNGCPLLDEDNKDRRCFFFFFINEGLLFASVTPSPSTAGKNFMTLKIWCTNFKYYFCRNIWIQLIYNFDSANHRLAYS